MSFLNLGPARSCLLPLTLVLVASACGESTPAPSAVIGGVNRAADVEPATAEPASMTANAPAASASGAGQIRSVYADTVDTNPLAEKLCVGFQEIHRKRKAQCCESRVGFLLTSECTRVFSGALGSKALVATANDVDRCVQAIEDQHRGCGWVGDWSQALPDACADILTGNLDDGATCRSSLECKRGLSCHGVSPTDLGVCGVPGGPGAMCDRGIDPAATYVSAELLRDHPQCEGFCANQRCHALAQVGERCVSDAHCGDGKHCARADGAVAAATKSCRLGERPVTTSTAPSAPLQERCVAR